MQSTHNMKLLSLQNIKNPQASLSNHICWHVLSSAPALIKSLVSRQWVAFFVMTLALERDCSVTLVSCISDILEDRFGGEIGLPPEMERVETNGVPRPGKWRGHGYSPGTNST